MMVSGSRHWSARRIPKLKQRARGPRLLVEQLEKRELLSNAPLPTPPPGLPANYHGPALLPADFMPPASIPGLVPKGRAMGKTPVVTLPLDAGPIFSSTPVGYTPAQMQQAYGYNQIPLPAGMSFQDAGSGQTIAIIDAGDDPNIVADVRTFDQTFGLGGAANDPGNTSFLKVVNQTGGSSLPPTITDFTSVLETSLDVEWAHAMAPGATILLVELNTLSFTDIGTGVEFAARQPGVSVISMSFASEEFPSEYYLDNLFTTPLGHQGVSFVASSGDSGAPFTGYPAISPNVLAVGGTALPADGSGNPVRALETGWPGSGGGFSTTEAEPAYQAGVQSSGVRTNPDLAYDAERDTGVPVLVTLIEPVPGKPWRQTGGTSAGAPQISALVAIANQLRVAAGEGTLDGPSQLLPALYQIAASDPNAFQDITTGNNGFNAGPGYDLVTGLGTPNAQFLAPDLAAVFKTPAAPVTLYWTGDAGDKNWNTPGNWSTVDPLVSNIKQFVLPGPNSNVVIDLNGATILHNAVNYDTIRSFTVTAANVTLDLGAGTLDLSGSGTRGIFQVDQAGDVVTMEGAVLKDAVVTAGTTLSATSTSLSFFGFQFADYPELNNVQLEGTLQENQASNGNGVIFQNGLILNGTIALGGTSDSFSLLLAGYSDFLAGNLDNNAEAIGGTGTIQMGRSAFGDALFNWGTTGTFTIGSHITVIGGGPGSAAYFEQTSGTGSLDNQGTLEVNGGSLQVNALGSAFFGLGSSTTGWTNDGVIQATGATLSLLGGWINNGTINVDATSKVFLGNPTFGQTPSSPGAVFLTWSSSGLVTMANGASVVFGSFLTTDQFQGAAGIPGLAANLALDKVALDGTLDNSAAANAVSHGVLAVSSGSGPVPILGGTINGGSITTGSNSIQVGGVTLPSGPLLGSTQAAGAWFYNVTNGGTIDVSGAALMASNVTNQGVLTFTQAQLLLQGSFTNTGTINGFASSLFLYDNWDNRNGTISVDPLSQLFLGFPTFLDPNSPPLFADGGAHPFPSSMVGTLHVADGASIVFGGLLTTDQLEAFPNLPGVSIHLSQDVIGIDGWLDNSPADNPVSQGVFAVPSAGGQLNLFGAYLFQGKILGNLQNLTGFNFIVLDGIELDGNLSVCPNGFGNVTILNSLTLNGTIDMTSADGFGVGQLFIGLFDNAPETITGTGRISLGDASTELGLLQDDSNAGLTIGSGITIDADASFSEIASEGSPITNLGTIESHRAGVFVELFGLNNSLGQFFNPFTNYSSGTLTGGTWEVSNGALWFFTGFDVTTNAANLSISGANSSIRDSFFDNALSGLTTNTAAGTFTVGNGYNFTVTSDFSNAGRVDIQGGAGFSTGSSNYDQSAGQTTVDGTLSAANVALHGGSLHGTGTIAGNVTNAGIVTPGDAPGTLTIQGNYTQTAAGTLDINLAGPASFSQLAVSGTATLAGTLNLALAPGFTPAAGASFAILTFAAHSGNFGTETGLILSPNKFFVPNFTSNNLTLVLGPGVSVVAGTDLYIIGGLTTNDLVRVKPIGGSNTGSTGVQVTATLNGVSTTTNFNQAFSTIYVFGFKGNDSITLAASLTANASINLGNGNDMVNAGAGNNTITLGNGNDTTTVGDGNNVIVEGNGHDSITAGNGDNLIVAGLGKHTVSAGNGSNILFDGSLQLTQPGDSLRQVLNDWMQFGALSTNVASIRSRLAVTYNTTNANTLDAGSGLDWFWVIYAKDSTNRKPTDLLN
jgi:hypothetical protein